MTTKDETDLGTRRFENIDVVIDTGWSWWA